MTDKYQIELVGAEALLGQLNAAISSLEHPRELLDAIGAKLEGSAFQRFTSKTDASGAAWAPISPSTAANYAKIKDNGKPTGGTLLLRSERMRDALTHNATDEYVEVGFGTGAAPYTVYHVTGTKNMPRRDPLFGIINSDGTQGELGAQDERDVLAVIDGFLNDALT